MGGSSDEIGKCNIHPIGYILEKHKKARRDNPITGPNIE